ncbi:MAG: methylated-DNA--[protein]-cysteine S-methyltransferase [Chloroflexi bacterium]|nr:methylated-DNA--[protein]-cysteine S-methyltransferase [Chloroflexota bacterium]
MGSKSKSYFYATIDTPLGWIGVLGSDAGLRRLSLPRPTRDEAVRDLGQEAQGAAGAPEQFEDVHRQLEEYFRGERTRFEVRLDMEGYSPFFSRAWQACASIPAGQTKSYAWLAAQAGNARAVRAAGQAMARNPIPLIIPCHRVVGSDGGLHGYGGGLPMKKHLLALENGGGLEGA